MKKTIAIGIIGASIAIVALLLNTQNDTDTNPVHSVEVRKGDEFIIMVQYTNNEILDEPLEVNVTLTTPAVLSLVNYEVGNIYNVTKSGVIRLINTTYTVQYEDLSGKKELSGNDISGISFNAKIGTDVTYVLSHEIILFEEETVEFKYRFNTNAAQSGTYDIRAVVNDNPILYRVKVTP